MITRMVVLTILLISGFLAPSAGAQPGNRYLDMKSRVLDLIFPTSAETAPYYMKMVLRFGDSNTQIAVVVYPGGRGELIQYRVRSTKGSDLAQLISKKVEETPSVKVEEIAKKIEVEISRSPLKRDALAGALKELKKIRISPVLASRVAVDDVSEYEFWYDTYQESVHYTITGPFRSTPQDGLVEWMLKFRTNLANLLVADGRLSQP